MTKKRFLSKRAYMPVILLLILLISAIGGMAIYAGATLNRVYYGQSSSTDILNVVLVDNGKRLATMGTLSESSYVVSSNEEGDQKGTISLDNSSVGDHMHVNIGQTINMYALRSDAEYTEKIGFSGNYSFYALGGSGGSMSASDCKAGSASATGGYGSAVTNSSIDYTTGQSITYLLGSNGADASTSNTSISWNNVTDLNTLGSLCSSRYNIKFYGQHAHEYRAYSVLGEAGSASYIQVSGNKYIVAGGGAPGAVRFDCENGRYSAVGYSGSHADVNPGIPSGYTQFMNAGSSDMSVHYSDIASRNPNHVNANRIVGTTVKTGVTSYGNGPKCITDVCIGWVMVGSDTSNNTLSLVYPGWSGLATRYGNKFDTTGLSDTTYSVTVDHTTRVSNPYIKLKCNAKYLTVANPSRNGYDFIGWRCSSGVTALTNYTSGSTKFKITSSGATITAQWKPRTYTVCYDGNDPDGGAMSSVDYFIGEPYKLELNKYYKAGYHFEGWSTSPNGPVVYEDGQEIVDIADPGTTLRIYAVWRPYKYEVTYTSGDGSGADIIEKWTYDEDTYLFNNTPNLPDTKVSGKVPHFTKTGFYVDSWDVTIEGNRDPDKDVLKLDTGTGYINGGATSSKKTVTNIITPEDDDCKVTLTPHWAPILYKVEYNNDTTEVKNRGYSFSTDAYTYGDYSFGESYALYDIQVARKNKYGESTYLGYGLSNGDVTKQPKWYVQGKSPSSYSSRLTMLTATDFKGTSTKQGTTWENYFKYLNPGKIQSLRLYCVWDDCPGLDPIDLSWGGQLSDVNNIIYLDSQKNSKSRSGKESEYQLLTNSNNSGSVWDREDSLTSLVTDLRNSYYIEGFDSLNIAGQKRYEDGTVEPTSYELKYTIVDSNGNKYTVSRKLYVGNTTDIKVGGSALQ